MSYLPPFSSSSSSPLPPVGRVHAPESSPRLVCFFGKLSVVPVSGPSSVFCEALSLQDDVYPSVVGKLRPRPGETPKLRPRSKRNQPERAAFCKSTRFVH